MVVNIHVQPHVLFTLQPFINCTGHDSGVGRCFDLQKALLHSKSSSLLPPISMCLAVSYGREDGGGGGGGDGRC